MTPIEQGRKRPETQVEKRYLMGHLSSIGCGLCKRENCGSWWVLATGRQGKYEEKRKKNPRDNLHPACLPIGRRSKFQATLREKKPGFCDRNAWLHTFGKLFQFKPTSRSPLCNFSFCPTADKGLVFRSFAGNIWMLQ